jgi:hypothetical protein
VSSSKLRRPNLRAGAPRLSRKPFVIVTTYRYTFNPKWEALLKSNSLTYFHSKEMHHTRVNTGVGTMTKFGFMNGSRRDS